MKILTSLGVAFFLFAINQLAGITLAGGFVPKDVMLLCSINAYGVLFY